jgi:hypothetical protein
MENGKQSIFCCLSFLVSLGKIIRILFTGQELGLLRSARWEEIRLRSELSNFQRAPDDGLEQRIRRAPDAPSATSVEHVCVDHGGLHILVT